VVGTLMTNIAVEQALKARGVELVRAKVGDRYVLEELVARRWQLGGENSGHLLVLDRHTTGDGIVSALQVLQAVRRTGKSLAALASHDHVTIDVVNSFALIDAGVADPGAYGLTNVTNPVWTGNYYGTGGSLTVHGKAASTYLFFDQLHPTATGHALVASAALSSLGLG